MLLDDTHGLRYTLNRMQTEPAPTTDVDCAPPLKWDHIASLRKPGPTWIFDYIIGNSWSWSIAREYVQRVLEDRAQNGWAPTDELHNRICLAAREEGDWPLPCFNLEDDLQVALWSLHDGLACLEVFIDAEEDLKISFTSLEIELALAGSVGALVALFRAKQV